MGREDGGGGPVGFEPPAQLVARLKVGREEFCQRLLTSLILQASYPRWNTRSVISAPGLAFLRMLYQFVLPPSGMA